MQPQPQAMSRNATRNRRKPVGKITAIKIPMPSAKAQAPTQRQYLIYIPPVTWSANIIYKGFLRGAIPRPRRARRKKAGRMSNIRKPLQKKEGGTFVPPPSGCQKRPKPVKDRFSTFLSKRALIWGFGFPRILHPSTPHRVSNSSGACWEGRPPLSPPAARRSPFPWYGCIR